MFLLVGLESYGSYPFTIEGMGSFYSKVMGTDPAHGTGVSDLDRDRGSDW